MKQSILNKWVRAARSGKYKKAIGALKISKCGKNATHCMLGVLCDLHAKETGTDWSSNNVYLHHVSSLPIEVKIWAGLNSCDPKIYDGISVTGCNDVRKFSLRKMAALLIEAQRKGWLGKVINDVRKRKKKTVTQQQVRTRIINVMMGELEQPEQEQIFSR